ncbi:MAG: dTDP-glucose 4,6-dehydratase [candidate division Zixibacteria bacterium CG_4_9_14_3_um_filter_46_8]|nr:MAG: dTDP-glucose 4,6-dehydratase [candidate division Zixibacteria bacterium CG_4_9_14_3_um_filter_46_8]
MRLMVTGGAGFIGANFIKHILRKYPKYRIINFDKLTYAGNLDNLSDIAENDNYDFIQGDIADSNAVSKVVGSGIDAIINFAAESHVDRSLDDASVFIVTNVVGTQVLLEAAMKCKVGRFIQISTDEVYGSLGASGYFTETTPLRPNSPYSASKAAADLLSLSYYRSLGLPVVITRCSNNYGPYQFPEKLIPLFIANAMEEKPLPVYGDGQYIRDWIYVEDHCRAIDMVLHRGKPGEVYNIGGGNERENLWITEFILAYFKRPKTLIMHVKDRPGHDRRYAIDAGKIKREFGFEPTVDLEEGLKQTIRWYVNNAEWLGKIRSGEYKEYYKKHYLEREKI